MEYFIWFVYLYTHLYNKDRNSNIFFLRRKLYINALIYKSESFLDFFPWIRKMKYFLFFPKSAKQELSWSINLFFICLIFFLFQHVCTWELNVPTLKFSITCRTVFYNKFNTSKISFDTYTLSKGLQQKTYFICWLMLKV